MMQRLTQYSLTNVFQYFLLFSWLMSTGCGGGSGLEASPSDPPPAWLTDLPNESGKLCAMGVSGPTYYPEDSIVNSKTQALSELGRSLRSQVKSKLLVQERGGSTDYSDVEIEDEVDLSSNEILKLAEVKSRWINSGGYPGHGTKGTVYTLICTPI